MPNVNRTRGALATVALGALATVAACGGGGSSTAPQKSVTKAQAQAIATRINLSTADLPGYTSSPNTESAKDKAGDAQLSKCSGTTPDSAAFSDTNSPNFDKGQTQVSSEVEVEPSASAVQHDLAAIKTSHAQQCVSEQLKPVLTAIAGVSGLTIHRVSISEPTSGTSGSFGLAAQIGLTAGGAHHELTQTELGFGRGNVEFTLSIQTVGSSAPQSLVTTLRALLIKRADANVPAGGLKPAQ
jgi:hypothetical protein